MVTATRCAEMLLGRQCYLHEGHQGSHDTGCGTIWYPNPAAATEPEKPRYSLVPWRALRQAAEVLTYGANKYPDEPWRSMPREKHADALMRHLVAHFTGDVTDKESGMPALAHALCRLMFLLELEGT